MQYYIIDGTFNDPIPISEDDLQKAISDHLSYLQKGFNEDLILLSGPKTTIGGGIIIMKANSLRDVEEYLSKDPLKTTGVQEYKITEFELHDCQPRIKKWFD